MGMWEPGARGLGRPYLPLLLSVTAVALRAALSPGHLREAPGAGLLRLCHLPTSVPHTALAALGVVLSPHMCHPFHQTNWGRSPHYTAEAAGPGMNKPLTPGSQPEVMECALDPGPLLTSQPPALGALDWESQHPNASVILCQSGHFSTPRGPRAPKYLQCNYPIVQGVWRAT